MLNNWSSAKKWKLLLSGTRKDRKRIAKGGIYGDVDAITRGISYIGGISCLSFSIIAEINLVVRSCFVWFLINISFVAG